MRALVPLDDMMGASALYVCLSKRLKEVRREIIH